MCIGSLTSRELRILKRVKGFAIDDEGEVYLPQKECALTSLAFMATTFRHWRREKQRSTEGLLIIDEWGTFIYQ